MNENVRLGIILVVLIAIGSGIWVLLSDNSEPKSAVAPLQSHVKSDDQSQETNPPISDVAAVPSPAIRKLTAVEDRVNEESEELTLHSVNFNETQGKSASGRIVAGDENTDSVDEGLGTVTGTVVDGQSGQPIREFQAMIRQMRGPIDEREEQSFQVFISNEGRFELTTIPIEPLLVYARAEGYVAGSARAKFRVGAKAASVVIHLFKEATVIGTVFADDGSPLPDALLFASRLPNHLRREQKALARTDSSGRFRIDSFSSQVTKLIAWHEDFVASATSLSLREEGETSVQFILSPGGTIEGNVRRGHEIATNAYITISNYRALGFKKYAQTNENGKYSAGAIPSGEINVRAKVRDYPATILKTIILDRFEHATLNFSFPAGNAGVDGVVTVHGRPGTNCHITLTLELADDQLQVFQERTNEDGYYVFKDVPEGIATITAYARRSDVKATYSTPINLVNGEILHLDLEVAGDQKVLGKVHRVLSGREVRIAAFPEGVLVPGSYFVPRGYFDDLKSVQPVSHVKPDGSFTLLNMCPGRYSLVAIELSTDADDLAEFRITVVDTVLAETELETHVDLTF